MSRARRIVAWAAALTLPAVVGLAACSTTRPHEPDASSVTKPATTTLVRPATATPAPRTVGPATTAGPGVGTVTALTRTDAIGHGDWQPIDLPDGDAAVRLVADGDLVLIGGQRPDSRPTLYAVVADRPQPIAVRPAASSPYAAVARWQSLALRERHLTAVGGAHGGAHANTRWTTWEADLSTSPTRGTLTETPQSFWTFGGWEAGGLVDAVATSRGVFIVGAWNGTTGLDIAVWHQDGPRWQRRDSAGTALASGPAALMGASAAASTGREC